MFAYKVKYVIKGSNEIISATIRASSQLDASTRLRKRIAKKRKDINAWSDITVVGAKMK